MTDDAANDSRISKIASVCHEANRAYCETLGDMSQPKWADAPVWQVESAENGVVFHLNNPSAGDAASHENWMRQKSADGWIYGPVKDVEAKQHPCMVPFDQLPPEQQAKDRLFRAIVRALA
jgi:cytochrome c1